MNLYVAWILLHKAFSLVFFYLDFVRDDTLFLLGGLQFIVISLMVSPLLVNSNLVMNQSVPEGLPPREGKQKGVSPLSYSIPTKHKLS